MNSVSLAIIIGVSKYDRPGSNLPACSNDVKLIKSLLEQTGKYNQILELHTETTSAAIKGTLASFVKSQQANKVQELFFYFTGHGGIHNENFNFLLTDYDENRKEATSLSNSELDQMLRSLSPSLTIKVVDACHAGVTYIKDPDILSKHLESSKRGYSNCYFMFSSQADQSSYQDKRLSTFTEAFVNACLSFPAGDIRYKDVMDFIADTFSTNKSQSPLFVTQATFTEVFIKIDQKIKDIVTSLFNFNPPLPLPAGHAGTALQPIPPDKSGVEAGELSLLELVKSQATQYCTQEEALAYLDSLRENLTSAQLAGDLAKMYELSSQFSQAEYDVYFIANRQALGKWLKDKQGDYFATVRYATEEFEEEVLDFSASNAHFAVMGGSRPTKKITRSRQVIKGFELTAEVPYKEVRILAKPNFENIPYVEFVLMFVFSKKEIVFFFCIHEVIESDWGKLSKNEDPKWRSIQKDIRGDLKATETTKMLLSKINEFIEYSVRRKLGLVADDPDPPKPAKGNKK